MNLHEYQAKDVFRTYGTLVILAMNPRPRGLGYSFSRRWRFRRSIISQAHLLLIC